MNSKYPLYLYNAKGESKVANNDTEVAQFKAQGFGPKYVHSHFPKILYGPKGESKTVNSEVEFQSAKDAGFGEDFVPVPEAPKEEVQKKEASAASDALIRVLLAENRDINSRLAAVEEIVLELTSKLGGEDEPTKEASDEGKDAEDLT